MKFMSLTKSMSNQACSLIHMKYNLKPKPQTIKKEFQFIHIYKEL